MPKKEYLKSLLTILEENPGHMIDDDGVIHGVGSVKIHPQMLSSFGKPVSYRDDRFDYDLAWTEKK